MISQLQEVQNRHFREEKKDIDPQYFGVSNNFLTIGIRFSENIDCYTVAFLAKFCIRIRFFQAFTLQGRPET